MAGMQQEGPGFHGDGPGDRTRSPVFNAPSVVSWLAVVIIVSHIVFLLLPNDLKLWVAWYGAVSPKRLLSGEGGLLAIATALVGHMLLHGGWMHLIFNTIWLMAFGSPVARRMGAEQPVGSGAASVVFLLFFVLSGAVGALVYSAFHPNETTMLIGASGGVSGLLGGLVRFAFRHPLASGEFAGLLERPVVTWTAVLVGLNVLVGVIGAGLVGADADIAWEAHIGGYFFGLLAFPFFARRARGR